jgi:GAF domain-containing protein
MSQLEALPVIKGELARLSALLGEGMDVGAYLDAVAGVAKAMVPSCVGVSITIVVDGEPYTVAATTPEVAELDAAQNLDGGPCIEAVHGGRSVQVDDVLDEDQWRMFAQASAARGVRSSLSFPIRDLEGLVAGGMNIYASEQDAFEDPRLVEVAFSADLREAVTNADLPFRARHFARELPERLAARERFDLAVGVLMRRRDWAGHEARARLEKAAELAGLPRETVAEVVLSLGTDPAGQ